jgi:hypothetical protein
MWLVAVKDDAVYNACHVQLPLMLLETVPTFVPSNGNVIFQVFFL